MRRVGTEGASHHYPASNTRLEADPVWLGSVEWWLEVGCWTPKPVRWNISRHRGGQDDKRVGSVAACPWRPAGGPPCNPPLCHPVGEGGLATQGQSCWFHVTIAVNAAWISCLYHYSLPRCHKDYNKCQAQPVSVWSCVQQVGQLPPYILPALHYDLRKRANDTETGNTKWSRWRLVWQVTMATRWSPIRTQLN